MVSYIDVLAQETQEYAYTGTGTIIADEKGGIYVLTAKHVCSPNPYSTLYLGFQALVEIQDVGGQFHNGEIILLSSDDDLCIIKYESDEPGMRSVAKFAPEPAKLDSVVYMYASPAGFYVPTAITRFTGTFSGESILWGDYVAVYTLPATGGASGGAITNSSGEIVGILHSVLTDFHHISLSTTYAATVDFIKELEVQENIIILD
jgi:hypothetical protein